MHRTLGLSRRALQLFLALSLCVVSTARAQWAQPPQQPAAGAANELAAPTGPIRLQQRGSSTPEPVAPAAAAVPAPRPATSPPVEPPSEFERFAGLPRFGASLVNELGVGAPEHSPSIPSEYVVQIGDELQIAIWGSVDADLRLTVDRSGRVIIPRVGPVLVAGVRYGDLQPLLTARVAQAFKNFELTVALGRLRGLRVYVTGFVTRPGAYVVPALSSIMNALMGAGGPASAGTFRNIELRRSGRTVTTLDLYDLLVRGDSGGDRLVQPDDVIHVPNIGPQVALRGSVNREAIFELKPGERLEDLLKMGGGLSVVADPGRIAVERLQDRKEQRVVQLPLPQSLSMMLNNGDNIRVFSAVDASLSVERQNKRVRVEGEVRHPGEYVLPPDSTLADALRAAGGLTDSAYVFGTQFTRESVRISQKANYERALRDLEVDMARSSSSQRVSSVDDANTRAAQAASTSRLIERLRALEPSGRVVLQLGAGNNTLPDLLLENGDGLYVPPRPSAVGVFGSVFNAGSYLFRGGRTVDEFLRLAGGPTKGADVDSIFVVRANGEVVSGLQSRKSWLNRGSGLGDLDSAPGDTIFVPEEMDKTTFLQAAKDWTQVLFQFGIGIAGIKSAFN